MAVGKLRTHAKKSVSDLSKEIVKQWKAAVEKAKAGNNHTGAFCLSSSMPHSQTDITLAPKKPNVIATAPAGLKDEVRTFKSDGAKGGTGNNTRDKCIELIYDGLASDATSRTSFLFLGRGWLKQGVLQLSITYSPKLERWKLPCSRTRAQLMPTTKTGFVPCL